MKTKPGIVIVVEDTPSLDLRNKSFALCQKISKLGRETYMFDGRRVEKVLKGQTEDNQNVLMEWIKSTSTGHIDPGLLCDWIRNHLNDRPFVVLVLDLNVGDTQEYGIQVYEQLLTDDAFVPDVEPIVYSRWASDDRRAKLVKTFKLPDGSRVLQRDTDRAATVIEEIEKIFRKRGGQSG